MHMKQFFTLVVCTLLAGLSTLRAEIVTAYVTDENNVKYNDVTMTLTYSDGVFTLQNFANTTTTTRTTDVSFTFDDNMDVYDYKPVEFVGDNVIVVYDYYYRFLNNNEMYSTGSFVNARTNETLSIRKPSVYNDGTGEYTYIMRLDKEEYGYEYYAFFYVSGLKEDGSWYQDFYYDFYFNSKPSGVATVAVDDENAPVEYYNLNGQRVLNPENGLFIRKQGSKVSKVIIR